MPAGPKLRCPGTAALSVLLRQAGYRARNTKQGLERAKRCPGLGARLKVLYTSMSSPRRSRSHAGEAPHDPRGTAR